jgi:hypothetical protein
MEELMHRGGLGGRTAAPQWEVREAKRKSDTRRGGATVEPKDP